MTDQNSDSSKDSSPFAPESKNDKEKLPVELSARKNVIDLRKLLLDPPGTAYEFKYGDYIPHAEQFNTYLEANITPGKTLKVKQEELVSLIKTLTLSMRGGSLSSLPMPCLGFAECIMGRSCPLLAASVQAPVGTPCPIEKAEGLGLARKLASDVGEDRSYTDDMMIQGIVALQMLKRRVYADMASSPAPTVSVAKGMDPRGNMIMEQVENPSYAVLGNIIKNEQNMLKALMLTYEQRQKKKKKGGDNAETTLNSLQKRLAEVRRDKKAAIIDVQAREVKRDGKHKTDDNPSKGRMGEDAEQGDGVAVNFDSLPSTGDLPKGHGPMGGEEGETEQSSDQGGSGDVRKQYFGKSPFG